MIKSLYFSFALFLCISQVLAVDPPPGLRPAKAVGNEQALAGSGLERKVLPFVEATKNVSLFQHCLYFKIFSGTPSSSKRPYSSKFVASIKVQFLSIH